MADAKTDKVIPTKISEKTERAVLTYATAANTLMLNNFSMRSHLEDIDRDYMRESDYTEAQWKARIANRAGDSRKFQDVTLPVIMPQVQAALGYLANVFLTGYPIFDVSADPQNEDAALQMATIVGENAITAGWSRQLMMFFRDGLKYNIHGIECDWKQQTVASVETDSTKPNSADVKNVLWKGNVLRRMDMYNTFFDPRVHPSEIHLKGEYAGYIELYSRVAMKKFANNLFGIVPPATMIRALESAPVSSGLTNSGSPFTYYTPIINPSPIMDRYNVQGFDWMNWATNASDATNRGIRYTNVYQIQTLYARILPVDFDLKAPAENTPQVWKFIIVNNTVLLYAEKLPNAHDYIPIFFGQPLEDGLDFQTKSFAQNVTDMQQVGSAMLNGWIASKRRLVGDRVLYDPLRVTMKDINSTEPAAKIPVRPTAFGKPVSDAVYQFPFRDEQTASLVQGAELISKYADLINGQNPAQQGQFVPGNKTKHEYADVMGHGNATNQMMAIATESQVFTPLKEVIKLNILQFQPQTTLFNRDKNQQVEVKPEDLRKTAVLFKVSDGLVPTDKALDTDEFQTALQTLGSAPQIAGEFNIGDLFTYLMKLRGADLRPFQKSPAQLQYEQALSAWQNAAASIVKQNPQMKPEDIQKILGPMPQPSPELQQEQQQKAQGGAQQPSPSAPGSPTGKTPQTTALAATQGT